MGCFGSVHWVFTERSQRYGKQQAAVGADLSCPHICKQPQNEEWKCVCDEMNIWI
ncbi:hypothetical protein [Prevotella pallens]